jgi:hypothetical protein
MFCCNRVSIFVKGAGLILGNVIDGVSCCQAWPVAVKIPASLLAAKQFMRRQRL